MAFFAVTRLKHRDDVIKYKESNVVFIRRLTARNIRVLSSSRHNCNPDHYKCTTIDCDQYTQLFSSINSIASK